ncbi:MAG: malate dehydrogenase [Candidatus Omnitrophica bacterium]|nr:malate dehydrogenase [Candidatus Omnitrophota bacterium]
MKKVTVIGAGNVGATCAHLILSKGLADVVFVDAVDGLARGKALDLMQAQPIEGFRTQITGTSYRESAGSDIVVITAGIARRPGMSREELAEKNISIVTEVAGQAIRYAPEAVFIIVSNPLDLMCLVCKAVTRLPRERVIGQAGVLDGARMSYFISQLAPQCSVHEIHALVLGSHGDTMVPVISQSSVGTTLLTDVFSEKEIEDIVTRTRRAGAEIVDHLKTGSAFYSPAAATVKMAEAILTDSNERLCCSVYLEGEYGLSGMFIGVPAVLGAGGVKQIIELPLNQQESRAFKASFDSLTSYAQSLGLL